MADLEIIIGSNKVEVTDATQVPITIDYTLEDQEDFQDKTSSQALNIVIPATLMNAKVANSFHNPSIADLSKGEAFKNFQPVIVREKGMEILKGKALLTNASHTDRPQDYTFDLYGDNADWMLEFANTTLYDILTTQSRIKFDMTKQVIMNSWQFDGRSEALPYVFAPARYQFPLGNPDVNGVYDDVNMLPAYMQPSLSKYWLLYWGFKSLGYKVKSDFFDTDFFRRQVMPWTWGNFQESQGTLMDNLMFLAKSAANNYTNANYNGYWDLLVTNDKDNGGFDNNGSYKYNKDTFEMTWTYQPQFAFGNLDAYFDLQLYYEVVVATQAEAAMWVDWFQVTPSGRKQIGHQQVFDIGPVGLMAQTKSDIADLTMKVNVNPGDQVIAKVGISIDITSVAGINLGRSGITGYVEGFKLSYTRIPLGGLIDIQNYTCFKNYSFLDFLRGLVDEFNLSLKTDATNKVVLMEPTHPYKLPNENIVRPGFFNGDVVDWSGKLDLSIKGDFQLINNYNQITTFKYRTDGSDSTQKIVQDRNTVVLGEASYQLPNRFQTGSQNFENRFFSQVMHYDVVQWKFITGQAPQMIVLSSDNSSNNSDASQQIMNPKSAYYKGLIQGLGWIFDGTQDDKGNWITGLMTAFPLMFGVNYMPGGENDPVLSYSDEKIGNDTVGYQVGQGLLKRFFLQRMANIRNGQWHVASFRIKNYDVAMPWHREFKTYLGQRWELIAISGYNPMNEKSTQCTLRKWTPVSEDDNAAVYPSSQSILNGTLFTLNAQTPTNDLKYWPLKCLYSDIPSYKP